MKPISFQTNITQYTSASNTYCYHVEYDCMWQLFCISCLFSLLLQLFWTPFLTVGKYSFLRQFILKFSIRKLFLVVGFLNSYWFSLPFRLPYSSSNGPWFCFRCNILPLFPALCSPPTYVTWLGHNLGFPSVPKRPFKYRYLSRIYRDIQSFWGIICNM